MFLQCFLLIVQEKLSLKVELLLKYELLRGLGKK